MSRLVQIAPGVLFSADVLSPEWGREYRQDEVARPVDRDKQSARRSGRTGEEYERDTHESIAGQMTSL